jgi:bis(5'-nucleosidyl)-tetraphosphatase
MERVMHKAIKTLSAGIIVVRPAPPECRYLLLRAYSYWDFPKGVVQRGEDPLMAAQREVKEETALSTLTFTWGQAYRETAPYARGKIARYYVAETAQSTVRLPINPVLGVPEHHEYRWANYPEAYELLAPRVRPILEWAATITGCGSPRTPYKT